MIIGLFAVLLLLFIVLCLVYFIFAERPIWSITIYTGNDPTELSPHPHLQKHPVLQASDINDVPASYVADPFMVHHKNTWYMFFEVGNELSQKGEIGLASSLNGMVWQYERIVLNEPFHLSYPYVFRSNYSFYMIPESRGTQTVRLYKALDFPFKWTLTTELLVGNFADASLLFRDGIWWMFVLSGWDTLVLYYANEVHGPWTEHFASPLIEEDINTSRPAGRPTIFNNKIVRYAQDGDPIYGSKVRAFQIDELTTAKYQEHELPQSPILSASGNGWNSIGMHHIDAHKIGDGKWIACVDGLTTTRAFVGKLRIMRMLGKLKKSAQSFSTPNYRT